MLFHEFHEKKQKQQREAIANDLKTQRVLTIYTRSESHKFHNGNSKEETKTIQTTQSSN